MYNKEMELPRDPVDIIEELEDELNILKNKLFKIEQKCNILPNMYRHILKIINEKN